MPYDPTIGQIMIWTGNFAPKGWANCDGSLLSIDQNPALYSLIGTYYGGDGRTTFGLPDLRNRFPVHFGAGPELTERNLGDTWGSQSATLTGTPLSAEADPEGTADAAAFTGEPEVATMPPYQRVRFVIAVQGIYPQRS
jgi:microcystin-dependent protein